MIPDMSEHGAQAEVDAVADAWRRKRQKRAQVPEDWSPSVQDVIKRAEGKGFVLAPRGEPPYGWLLTRDGVIVAEGSLEVIVEALEP